MHQNIADSFSSLIRLIENNQLSEIEAERLLNAMARLESGTPTGVLNSNNVGNTPERR